MRDCGVGFWGPAPEFTLNNFTDRPDISVANQKSEGFPCKPIFKPGLNAASTQARFPIHQRCQDKKGKIKSAVCLGIKP
jgi:hypothetical protein